tara:strand:- start:77717 stop:78631 length:915 start_codon:yes stop_codon:yes gene_type:complete
MPCAAKNRRAFNDFCEFAKKQVYSWDLDPMYPVLKEYYLSKGIGLKTDKSIWMTFLYVAWYHIGSAVKSWRAWEDPSCFFSLSESQNKSMSGMFNTGTERRLFRGRFKDFTQHVNSFISITGKEFLNWVSDISSPCGEEGWESLRKGFEKVKFNGPWASYKFADLMKHVHEFDITANDIGVGGGSKSAGPVVGMSIITERGWEECARDVGLQKKLLSESILNGVPFDGLDQMETALCDFNSLYKGKFYVGHDIDKQMEDLKYACATFWEARRKVIPQEYLGEVNGWFGVRGNLKKIYKTKGVII